MFGLFLPNVTKNFTKRLLRAEFTNWLTSQDLLKTNHALIPLEGKLFRDNVVIITTAIFYRVTNANITLWY